MNTQWIVKTADFDKASVICQELGLLPLTARLLCSRGQDTPEKAKAFLECNYNCKYNPFLLKDMDKAVERIRRAITNKERVCIYGDYDVDGVTATTILYVYLTEQGVDCDYFIPGRLEDGYGLNKKAISNLGGKTDLIITVDTGITAVEETEYASSLGIDMVITDHHSCRDVLPNACAVVNPHREDCEYPFKHLAGVGVVYKLLSALEGDTDKIIDRFGDIIAIGTIADVMPIVDENRYITALGIKKLQNTSNLGLKALMAKCNINTAENKKVNSISIGFTISPRINAAGRIKNAKSAVELLLSKDEALADALAEELCAINKERQNTEQKIYEEVQKQIEAYKDDNVYVLSSDGWHQGVIGVVASRLTERYGQPSILFSFDGDVGKGSGRSIKGFSMLDALKVCDGLLEEYGGHELAAGLTINRENLDAFRAKINEYAFEKVKSAKDSSFVEADCEIFANEITLKQAYEISRLEPFGLQNPVPLLLLRDACICEITPLASGKHVRLTLECEGLSKKITAIYFNMRYSEFSFRLGDRCDLLTTLEVNEFRGVSEAKLYIKKMRFSSAAEEEFEEQLSYYKAATDVENHVDLPKESIPSLNQFRALFRLLKRELGESRKKLSFSYIQRTIKETEDKEGICLCSLHIIFDVLRESNLAEWSISDDGSVIDVRLLPFKGKVNLDNSPLLLRIKSNHKFY
ncbi:MAG: single-stranded-DNA-specific exonuclease RecJ [Clostridia bacterium]|nr:single-stranded-DNA-specific exonuclease RecJ [Clostridia bacterium]